MDTETAGANTDNNFRPLTDRGLGLPRPLSGDQNLLADLSRPLSGDQDLFAYLSRDRHFSDRICGQSRLLRSVCSSSGN
jgi:hypothetical protein